jgi:hypothetical protein
LIDTVRGKFKLVDQKRVLEKGLYAVERVAIIERHGGLHRVNLLQRLGLPDRAGWELLNTSSQLFGSLERQRDMLNLIKGSKQ